MPGDEGGAGGEAGAGSEARDAAALGGEVNGALAVLLDIPDIQVLCPEGVTNELTFLVEQEKLVAIGD